MEINGWISSTEITTDKAAHKFESWSIPLSVSAKQTHYNKSWLKVGPLGGGGVFITVSLIICTEKTKGGQKLLL